MNDGESRPQSTASDVIIGLAFMFGGVVWIAVILFFTVDAIGDYREAHSSETGIDSPWTLDDTLLQMGGMVGFLFGFTPPSILIGYGFYLLFSTLSRLIHRST